MGAGADRFIPPGRKPRRSPLRLAIANQTGLRRHSVQDMRVDPDIRQTDRSAGLKTPHVSTIIDLKVDPTTEIDLSPGSFSQKSRISVVGRHNSVRFEPGAQGHYLVSINGTSCRLEVGANVRVGSGLTVVMARGPSRLRIGADCTFTAMARLLMHESSELEIGADCMFAANVDVMTSDMHPMFGSDGERLNKPGSIVIGDHVWIGQGARILKGAQIGAGSVIALNAVVTAGTYPANAVLAGSPARIVRRDVRWERKLPE